MKKILLILIPMMLFVGCEKNEPRGTIGTVEIKAYPIDKKIALSVNAYMASKITIDWGDGTIEKFSNSSFPEHEYFNSEIQTILITAEILTAISISGENFKELKLRNCLDLKYLSCAGLHLKELEITEAPSLEELKCYDNQLTVLDLSKNTSLTHLECWWNQLTNLDLTKNTVLRRLECYVNLLTNLDVGNNTALVVLDCGWNQLTDLDVSKNTELSDLACWANQLTSLTLSGSANLSFIQCNYNQLTTETLNAIFESLPIRTYSGYIHIRDNPGTLEANRLIATEKGWHIED